MKHSRTLILAAALAVLAACQSKAGSIDNSPAVATVNGTPIARDFFESYTKLLTGRGTSDLTPDQRNEVLDSLIRFELVAQQATKEGLDKTEEAPARIQVERFKILQSIVATHYLKDKKPTDQELRAEYETEIAAHSRHEYHARHILLATEPFAEKIVDRLDKGEKFDDVAKKESMDDTSGKIGGDLGWLSPDGMVKPFADALVQLKPGEFTHKPVQTQFGWHVIQLVETRDLPPPSFDQVKQDIERAVYAKKFKAYTDDLMRNSKIDKKLDDAKTEKKG
jgi:peptidyl-prolyl cis-trans isomerase C